MCDLIYSDGLCKFLVVICPVLQFTKRDGTIEMKISGVNIPVAVWYEALRSKRNTGRFHAVLFQVGWLRETASRSLFPRQQNQPGDKNNHFHHFDTILIYFYPHKLNFKAHHVSSFMDFLNKLHTGNHAQVYPTQQQRLTCGWKSTGSRPRHSNCTIVLKRSLSSAFRHRRDRNRESEKLRGEKPLEIIWMN